MDKFELKNKLPEIPRMLSWIDAYGVDHRLSPEVVNALSLSLDELVTNTISYGYDDKETHSITVTLSDDEHTVKVRLEDDARAFNPMAVDEVDISTTLEEKPIGGLGIHLVKKFMDTIQYERVNEKNILTITKKK
jgi:serine/threonine-protein kinase RsbW/sigma-B regulation protein RsbU (phosphoserine phosphatase)